ncbi:MAG: hypothetical protein U9P72_08085 [Campylobacterota bacterium]|nr:hypothetical protein [Campylobacterota bacterium]
MTYGEYYYLIKYDMRLKDGVWVTNKPRITIPSKMSREEALVYYTKKFSDYWERVGLKKQD